MTNDKFCPGDGVFVICHFSFVVCHFVWGCQAEGRTRGRAHACATVGESSSAFRPHPVQRTSQAPSLDRPLPAGRGDLPFFLVLVLLLLLLWTFVLCLTRCRRRGIFGRATRRRRPSSCRSDNAGCLSPTRLPRLDLHRPQSGHAGSHRGPFAGQRTRSLRRWPGYAAPES